jgi:nicotinate-nucleotide adenylyltransferase
MKIGIFGGTFNPVHYGHLRAAEEAREMLSLDKVLFIPSGNPPLKTKDLAAAIHRYKMTRLACVKNRMFDVLDIECRSTEKSYTVNTVEKLLDIYGRADLYLVLGIDAFLDLPNWWKPEKLVSLSNFAIVSRPASRFTDLLSSPYLKVRDNYLKKLDSRVLKSHAVKLKTRKELVMLNITPLGISSTEIRKCIRQGLSIKYMLPEEVESYIISNKLYK